MDLFITLTSYTIVGVSLYKWKGNAMNMTQDVQVAWPFFLHAHFLFGESPKYLCKQAQVA